MTAGSATPPSDTMTPIEDPPVRFPSARSFVALLAIAFVAACEDSTGPTGPLDVAGLQADLAAASAAVNSPASASLGALGPAISGALADAGGSFGAAALPAALLKDPNALLARAELRSQLTSGNGGASVIPQVALGKTFQFDTIADRYAAGDRTGAPANGVRFILYAVDPVTEELVFPLVETGYADLTRTVTNQAITARVEAFAGGIAPVKVLSYTVRVEGTITNPTVLVAGFARNAADSLAFTLSSTLSLANSTVDVDWRTAVPTRGLSTRVQQTLTGGEVPQIVIDGLLTGQGGHSVGMTGTILAQSGGTLLVKVDGTTFATLSIDSLLDETPTIVGANGEPLTPAEQALLRQIVEWFQDAFDTYEDLLEPADRLLDIVL